MSLPEIGDSVKFLTVMLFELMDSIRAVARGVLAFVVFCLQAYKRAVAIWLRECQEGLRGPFGISARGGCECSNRACWVLCGQDADGASILLAACQL